LHFAPATFLQRHILSTAGDAALKSSLMFWVSRSAAITKSTMKDQVVIKRCVSRGAYKVYKESKPSREGETEGTSSNTNGKEGNDSSQNRVHEHHGVGNKKPSAPKKKRNRQLRLS